MHRVSSTRPSPGRYRRRILGWGAVAVLIVFAIGAPIFVNRVEDDLERRVIAEFDEAGVGPVRAQFSGQSGTLWCDDGPVEIPDGLLADGRDLWGVVSLDVDVSCTSVPDAGDESVAPATATTAPAATTTTTDVLDDVATLLTADSQFSTLADLLADVGMLETLVTAGPFTVFAPTDDAFESLGPELTAALERDPDLLETVLTHHVTDGTLLADDLVPGELLMLDGTPIVVVVGDVIALTDPGSESADGQSPATVTESDLIGSNGVVHAIDQVLAGAVEVGAVDAEPGLNAELLNGQLFLSGVVATDEQAAVVVGAARAQLDPANVIDELIIDEDSAQTDLEVAGFAILTAAMPANLTAGIAQQTGGLSLSGVYLGADEFGALTAVSDDLGGIELDLTERADAGEDDAAALENDLNALVGADPILFEPSSTTISPASSAVIDRVAAVANRQSGIDIEIQGFTDTDGTAASNQSLSEGRANAVRDALVARGLPSDALTAVGFGGTSPVLDADGAEDKAASRRVEFVVTVQ